MNKTLKENLEEIRKNVPLGHICGQLAEECSELSKASLKLQRLIFDINVPEAGPNELVNQFYEETADTLLCMQLMAPEKDIVYGVDEYLLDIIKYKAERWVERIKNIKMIKEEN